jgi:hypothetical protein
MSLVGEDADARLDLRPGDEVEGWPPLALPVEAAALEV